MAIQQREQFGQAYRYSDVLPNFQQQQCCRCGQLVGGMFDGLRPVNEHRLVVILQSEYITHCVCQDCRENEEGDYFLTR